MLAWALVVVLTVGGMLVVRSSSPFARRLLPPCPMHALTGLWCPGCGATRSLRALLHGDVSSAVTFNPLFVAVLATVLALLAIRVAVRIRRATAWWPDPSPTVRWAIFGVIVAFGVLRNVPLEPFRTLAPHPS